MRRTAVIEDFLFDPIHNHGHPVPSDPQIYYDLNNTLCYSEALPEQKHKLRYILKKDFDMDGFAPEDITYLKTNWPWTNFGITARRTTQIAQICAWQRHCPLIILESYINDYVPDWYEPILRPIPAKQRYHVKLPWSHHVCELASDTISQLCDHDIGTIRREDPSFLTGNTDSTAEPVHDNYWVIHVRRPDSVGAWRESYAWWHAVSVPSNILANLRRIKGFNKNTTIYLMSNETDPTYYNALKAKYPRMRTYRDFPKLKALIHGGKDHKPNNYLLFAVERILWNNASQRITNRLEERETIKVVTMRAISPGYYIAMLTLKLHRALGRIRSAICMRKIPSPS
jgi:hypothetical protein